MPVDVIDAIHALELQGVEPLELERRVWEQFGCERAVLVLDSVGFTRVSESEGIVHYLGLLGRLRELLRPVMEDHGCLRLRAETDNLYVEFSGVVDALDAALAANEAVHAADLMLNEREPFGVCIGIGHGTLLRSEHEGVFGTEMNLASKLGEDTADPHEILLTAAAYAALPMERRNGFEERFTGISEHAISFYWRHWDPPERRSEC
ncbi:MAG: adenylate/guanylate cyclase domain-containing protein [Lentisphaerae bacterium]|jgi:adenylate cyclase|nr:adenylate/guanylate cyclase domain-containing protein [Lentisphaerota bacterium]MBT4814706.1 adenylate/guanylate cyclase domain-containing protein [Lentisphaerota bacterium]MBT5611788.1 adenylate/guanylate cyclase domain-containing protein [Lentisphaerota bacterium]MBT7056944.1 adenylate/guanylate cyclase domain-containing protein [Lentisphaerota bacterium]MBT7845834.1 adenylate/guanylate cyclase domain-containing protein [Lentisphaerota bacterium]